MLHDIPGLIINLKQWNMANGIENIIINVTLRDQIGLKLFQDKY